MSAPAFGDRVKVKVDTEPGHRENESRSAGETALVVEAPFLDERVSFVRLLFEGDKQPRRVRVVDVTTDLEWATPRESAILEAFADVLYSEGQAKQRGRAMRIAARLLKAYDAGLERYAADEAARVAREKRLADEKLKAEEAARAEAAKDDRPHSRACGITGHPHGQACAKDCPTCHPAKTA